MSLSLGEKLVLWKYLDAALTALHKKQLVPGAQKDLVPTERLPVKFGGRLAAWVTQPKDRQPSAYIASEARLLAWAKVNYPAKVEHPVEVEARRRAASSSSRSTGHSPCTSPSGLTPSGPTTSGAPSPSQGHYITATGEKLTEVPGIEVPEPAPSSPQVRLEKDAGEIIAAAWPEIQPGLREVLALPAPPEASDAS